MQEPRAGYGYGILKLHDAIARELAPMLRIELTDVQGHLKEQGIFDQLKHALLLPEDYAIHGVYLDVLRHAWNILVEAPGVPEVEEGARFPELVPTYQRTYHEETGAHVTILLRIEMENGHLHVCAKVVAGGKKRNEQPIAASTKRV